MNKSLLLFFFLLSFVQISNAQFLWYENETNTFKIEKESTTSGTFFTDVTNPDNTGINTNAIVSKFNRDEGEKSFLQFDLYKPITDFSSYSVTIKAYLDIPTASITSSNSKLRVYFDNASVGGSLQKQLNFTVGQEWQSFTFNFNGTTIPQAILDANGYDRVKLGFATGSTVVPAMTYYIDSMSGTTDQVVDATNHSANWLSGSWGFTFPIYGGERLDDEVDAGLEYIKGAQECIDLLPATGHVITNLSNFAKSYYFTLRDNPNVNIATEIDELLVPTLENEKIILDVLQMYKDAGKKNILYISTNYFDRLGPDESSDPDFNTAHAAWVTYYTNNFAGDEYAAYRDLVQGFILRIADLADGYWLDTTAELDDDGNMEDFVQMIRDADPVCTISAQPSGVSFLDEYGVEIQVDSDGVDDEDDRDYKVSHFTGVNSYQDYTSGHVSSLQQGAPPNSWSYEEFSIPDMIDNPWSVYEGKVILKHAWFPIRAAWHSAGTDLIFGTEDAYRFTKRLKDANAGVTFATTVENRGNTKLGYMSVDEMTIMKTINDRLLSNPVPDFEPYVRPEGAYLVGETLSVGSINENESNVKFYPNPVIDELTITRSSSEGTHIKIISLLGIKVFETTWNDGLLSKQLDLTSLNPGLYLVNLSNGNNSSMTQKIIISK